MTSIRVPKDTVDSVKRAAKLKGESIVAYADRVLREQALADVRAEEEATRRWLEAKERREASQ